MFSGTNAKELHTMWPRRRVHYLLSGPGLTIAGPLWSLQVDEAGDGGGGMSGLNVSLERLSAFTSALDSLQQRHQKRINTANCLEKDTLQKFIEIPRRRNRKIQTESSIFALSSASNC